jgi:hypothetical protein
MPALIRTLLALTAAAGLFSDDAAFAAGRKPPAKPAAVKTAAKPPPPAEADFAQIPIRCGAPVQTVKIEAKGLAKIASLANKEAALPETCVLSLFKDPAFPISNPNSPATSLDKLFDGRNLMRGNYPTQEGIARAALNFLAKTGPRPAVRAQVVMAHATQGIAQAVFASPGERDPAVVISDKLFSDLTTESDLESSKQYVLFIAAHEYAHLLLKHPPEIEKNDSSYDDIRKFFQGAALAYAIYNGVKMGPNATSLEQQLAAKQSAAMFLGASLIGDMAASESRRMMLPKFSKDREREADLLAVDLLAYTTADIFVGVEGLKKIRGANQQNLKALREQAMAAKKAQAEARIQLAAMSPLLLLQKDQDKAIKQIKAIGITIATDAVLSYFDERKQLADVSLHDDAAKREGRVKLYMQAHYPWRKDQRAVSADLVGGAAPQQASVAVPDFGFTAMAAERSLMDAVRAAETALNAGKVAEARKAIDQALNSPIGKSAKVQDVAGMVSATEDKPDQAIKHYRAVLATGHHNDRIYRNIASAQQQKGDIPGALKTLADGAEKIGSIRPFIVARIALQVEAGDTAGAEASLQECVATKDPMLITVCTQTAHPETPDTEADKQVAKGETAGDTQLGGAIRDSLLKSLAGKK